MTPDQEVDARLARLARATKDVLPRADFSKQVMLRVERQQIGTLFALRRPARRFLPIGMMAAAMAITWAVSVNNQVDEAMASSDDTELSW